MPTLTTEVSDFVATITHFQRDQHMSDRELARRLHISSNTPGNWRAGRDPSINAELVVRAAHLLGVRIEDVYGLLGLPAGDIRPDASMVASLDMAEGGYPTTTDSDDYTGGKRKGRTRERLWRVAA